MKTKREVLQSVHHNVSKHGIVACQYVSGDCYCAVGYVLKELGVTDKELLQLGSDSIEGIFEEKAPESPRDLQYRVATLARDAGFTKSELRLLQEVNDTNEDENRNRVVKYVELMIESLPL